MHAFTSHWLKLCLASKRSSHLHAILMSHAHLLTCSLSTTFPFCSSSTFSSSTSSVTPCQALSALHKEDYGRMAPYAPPRGYEPNRLDLTEEFDTHTSVFHSSDPKALCRIDDERDESFPAENMDEQIRVAFASQMFVQ